MTETLVAPKTAGPAPPDVPEEGFGDYGPNGDAQKRLDTARLGIWILLGTITMLFAAFTSAYIVRSAGDDWVPLDVPWLLWVNTAIIIASSVTLEIARRAFMGSRPISFRKWSFVTALLGVGFLVGQVGAWAQLAAQGIYLQSHPHSSFFYVLTGVHAAHLLAGVIALFYVLGLAMRYRLVPGESSAPSVCATYWHFVGGVWIYLFVVLFYM